MRIAFLLRHALYLRNFESALRQLAEHGHEILLIFPPSAKRVDRTLVDALTRAYPNIREETAGRRTNWWWPVSDGARSLRDSLRYFAPEYRNAPALVARGTRRLPRTLRWAFAKIPGVDSTAVRRLIDRSLRLLDRAIPPDPDCLAALRRWSPDLLIVSPMVDFNYSQTDYVKAARRLAIPTVLAVASWDNLTNKGLIQVWPDLVLVWNEAQEREAHALHGIPLERIQKTGAQLYDHWFEMRPSADRTAFCARVGGLNPDPETPIILYLCSSVFICRDEVSFVREWLAHLRQSADARLKLANVIVRPHPAHAEQWQNVDLSSPGPAVVWPAHGGVPVDSMRKRDYFDSLYHAGVVVGVNTSGFIEAGILGRRTLTLVTDRFRTSQEGTLHFHHLTDGGLLEVARNYEEHFSQLRRALADPGETERHVRGFIASFVRPAGVDKPATPIFVKAIEEARSIEAQPWMTPRYAAFLRATIWAGLIPLRRRIMERLAP